MNKGTNAAKTDPRDRCGDIDLVGLYVRDIRGGERLSREDEIALAEQMLASRRELTEIAQAILWKATDELGPVTGAVKTANGKIANGRIGRLRSRSCGSAGKQRPLDAYLADVKRMHGDVVARDAAASRPAAALDALSPSQIESVLDKVSCAARMLASGRARSRKALSDIAACFGLTPADMKAIGERIAEHRARLDAARERMIAANLKLVVAIARRFRRRAVDPADLIQEGNLALLRAIDAFDPRRGSGFAALACTVIRRAMNAFASANVKPVRVPKQTLEFRRRIALAAWELGRKTGEAVTPEEVADYLDLSLPSVVAAMVASEDRVSFDDSFGDRGESLASQLAEDSWVDASEALASHQHDIQIDDVVAELDERDRSLLQARYGAADGTTLAQVGQELGVTRERTRQLEARALRRLRQRGSRNDGVF